MRIEVAAGRLRGSVADGVARFLGVPFAAPINATNRFTLPQALPPWSGERSATVAAAAPSQPPAIGLGMRGATNTSEDCLYVNVFVPARKGAARPVFVWIFGGGFIYGDAADPLFDGGALALQQDMVVVTFNYRLGLWGFAPLHAANVGLADQIAALRWVAQNIAAFGGDPRNITVVGESAGAMSVCNLLACPAAQGLFHRAIAQSGAADNVGSATQAAETAATLRAELGSNPDDADIAALLIAQRKTIERLRPQHRATPLRPFVDGTWLPQHPVQAAAAPHGADIPLIMGMNAQEHRLYVRPNLRVSDAALVQHLERRLAERSIAVSRSTVARIIDHYRSVGTHPRNPNAAMLADIDTELRFRRPMLRYADARGRNTWLYQFDWPSPALGGWLGATHAVEIPFVFGNFDLRTTAKFVGSGSDATQLSNQLMALWGHFARHGAPPAHWPAYDATAPAQLHLNRAIEARRIDADPTVALWNTILGR